MSPASRFVPASPSYTVVKKRNPLEDGLPRMKWPERIKTDFAFTKPPYEVKTTGQALQVVLSPFWSVPDLIAPRFIQDGDHLYAKPIETLVLAVRGLAARAQKNAQQAMRRIPLYNTVVQLIRDWDVDTMAKELTLLQREPRGRTFADLGPLAVTILRPLYRLSRLNPHVHLLPAITKMYELALMYLTTKEERDLLLKYYDVARIELPLVFTQLRQRWYPVLLKLLSDQYLELDPFFLDKDAAIMEFLGLKEEDLVHDTPEIAAVEIREPAKTSLPAKGATTPRLASQGFEFLDQLFPKAGWKNLPEHPDFFSYFQTIFDYPKGSDLIPVDDPIQVIQPLSEIIQQLLYGFQTIQWGTAVNQLGEVVRLQEELDKAIARWHFFHEEFFGKNYLPLLQEYCREVERSGPAASDSKRREHQLMWFKRNYLMPYLVLPIMDDVRPKSLGYPNLSIQVRDILDLLAPVAAEVEQKGGKATVLLNPDVKVKFPVITMVSARFQSILRRTDVNEHGDRRILDHCNNKTLLFYTLSLLATLDHLLSNPESALYLRKPAHLYRSSGEGGDQKPVYNAPKRNSLGLLKKLNEQPPAILSEFPWLTRGADLFGPLVAAEELKRRIQEHYSSQKPFVLLSLRVWPEDRSDFPEFVTTFLEKGTLLHPQDDGSWSVALPATEEEAEELARKILGAAARRTPPFAVGTLITPFYSNWNLERLVGTPSKGWIQAEEVPPQVLGLWVNVAQTYEFRTDVPTVAVAVQEDPETEAPLEAASRADAPPEV